MDVKGQKWYLKNVGKGYITLKSALGDFMIDVTGGENKDGTNIEIYNAYSGTPQQFMLKTSVDGSYIIATKSSNITKVLDDFNFEKADGTKVCQWTYGGRENQRWIFEHIDDNQKIEQQTKPVISSDLNLNYKIDRWNNSYQVNFKLENNTNLDISNWRLKLKKNDINIESNWCIKVEEDSEYYIISPLPWNSNIPRGGIVEFGIQGTGNIKNELSYVLK